jgi:glycosyltransferase involved in cell wall biosynthesis
MSRAPIERPHVLLVCSHPVQYTAPIYRRLAERPEIDIEVAYCTFQGAQRGLDPDFGVELAWDTPLLEGFRWIAPRNVAPRAGLGRFFGLLNPGLWRLVRGGGFDAVVVHGYFYASFCLAIAAGRLAGVPVILATDAVTLGSASGWWWKRWIKRAVVRRIYASATMVLVPSSATFRFIRSLGIAPSRIGFAHYTVDNEFFGSESARHSRADARKALGIREDATVILFCAKLVPRKRPELLLKAFARAHAAAGTTACLVYAGEGALRAQLQRDAAALGVAEDVRFLGFVNQSRLPLVYRAADLLVLPSSHEPWGLVVNEAMACGVPAAVSDRVGAAQDIVEDGKTGFVFPVDDADALTALLAAALRDPQRLSALGDAARCRMAEWSYDRHIDGFLAAVRAAVDAGAKTA